MESLNHRAEQILKLVIESYIQTGSPVGSKTISEHMGMQLSSASIRNVMSDLEKLGYLYAPHTSAGRLPTEAGLTVFVEGLLEVNTLSAKDQKAIAEKIKTETTKTTVTDKLDQIGRTISGLSDCAGLVIAPKSETVLKEIEFLKLSDQRILVILVDENSNIENRVIEVSENIPMSALRQASNYLNSFLLGATLSEIQKTLEQKVTQDEKLLDSLTKSLVDAGIAELSSKDTGEHLIIRGQAKLLDNVTAMEDLERLRSLFTALEEKDTLLKMLGAVENAQGIQIFIGSNNSLFEHSGCSLILSPYKDSSSKADVVGAVGVIGPTRLNYRRVIPVINYTSELLSDIL